MQKICTFVLKWDKRYRLVLLLGIIPLIRSFRLLLVVFGCTGHFQLFCP
jgi:hypothetical protein